MKLFYTGTVLLCLALLQVACKRTYKASSGSMENTIMIGQKFYVEPTDVFERNDIVVFNYFGNDYSSPLEIQGQYKQHWEKRVYRIVAVSGDIVEVAKGELLVNKKTIALPPLSKLIYLIKSIQYAPDLTELDPNATMLAKDGDTLQLQAELTADAAKNLQNGKLPILSIDRILLERSDTSYAMSSATDNWSTDNYGPLKIPSPGEAITVNSENFKLFKNIPDIQMGNNVIKEKLYFLMGDNRGGAEDSRFIGLISHSKLDGIAKMK